MCLNPASSRLAAVGFKSNAANLEKLFVAFSAAARLRPKLAGAERTFSALASKPPPLRAPAASDCAPWALSSARPFPLSPPERRFSSPGVQRPRAAAAAAPGSLRHHASPPAPDALQPGLPAGECQADFPPGAAPFGPDARGASDLPTCGY